MVDKIRTLIRMFKIYGKMDLLWFLRDTKYCLMYIFSDMISTLAVVVGVFLLAVKFDGIGGMTEKEIIFMLGYSVLVEGVFALFFISNNAGQISRTIGRGQMDHKMIQPVPVWMQLAAEGFSPVSGNGVLLCGIGLIYYSVSSSEINFSGIWIVVLLINLAASCTIMICTIYILSCTAFYAPAAAEEIASVGIGMFESLKNYPLGGMNKSIQIFFCSLIPVGMIAWFPSRILLGKFDIMIFMVGTAAAFLILAILIFKKGMRYYAKYGSPRYSSFGHR